MINERICELHYESQLKLRSSIKNLYGKTINIESDRGGTYITIDGINTYSKPVLNELETNCGVLFLCNLPYDNNTNNLDTLINITEYIATELGYNTIILSDNEHSRINKFIERGYIETFINYNIRSGNNISILCKDMELDEDDYNEDEDYEDEDDPWDD
jgi:hypothetical protein